MKNILVLALCMLSLSAFAQKTKNTTANFWVAGVCGMCEKTIEKAVDVKGVVAFDYNLNTHRLDITFNPAKITIDQIHSLINAAGYDTEKSNATEAQYNRVHGCCKYRTLEQHP
jgi:copper chaperone CopZ